MSVYSSHVQQLLNCTVYETVLSTCSILYCIAEDCNSWVCTVYLPDGQLPVLHCACVCSVHILSSKLFCTVYECVLSTCTAAASFVSPFFSTAPTSVAIMSLRRTEPSGVKKLKQTWWGIIFNGLYSPVSKITSAPIRAWKPDLKLL